MLTIPSWAKLLNSGCVSFIVACKVMHYWKLLVWDFAQLERSHSIVRVSKVRTRVVSVGTLDWVGLRIRTTLFRQHKQMYKHIIHFITHIPGKDCCTSPCSSVAIFLRTSTCPCATADCSLNDCSTAWPRDWRCSGEGGGRFEMSWFSLFSWKGKACRHLVINYANAWLGMYLHNYQSLATLVRYCSLSMLQC